MSSQDGQRQGDRPAFTAARPTVPRLHLAGLVPHQQHGTRSPEQQLLRSPASTARSAASPRHGGHSQPSGRTPRSALQSSRLGTQATPSDKPISDLWHMALNHISNVLHGGEAAGSAGHTKQPARGLDADTEDALMSYLHKQILSRQEAKRTFVDGHVTEKIEPIDTRDAELVLQDARAQAEEPAQEEYDEGPPSARYWRTVNQIGSAEHHVQRLQQRKDVQQDLRVWADEVLSGRLLHELDMHLDEQPHASSEAATAAAGNEQPATSSSRANSSNECSSAQQAPSAGAGSASVGSKEPEAPPNTARGLRADLKAQIDAQVEAEIDKRIAVARSQWELNFRADLGLVRSMKDERAQLKAELAAAMNQLRIGGHNRAGTGKGGQPGGLKPLSMLGDSRRSLDATGGDSSGVEARPPSTDGSSTDNAEGVAQLQAAQQQQLADALQQLADVHEVVGSLVREVEAGAAQLQQAQQRAGLERAAKDAALEQVAQLYSQLAAAQQLVEQNLQLNDRQSSSSNIVDGPASDAEGAAGQQHAEGEAEQLQSQPAAMDDKQHEQEELKSLRGRLAAAEYELAQARIARDAAQVGREDAMQALERATQDSVRLGKQLRAATAAAEAAGAAPWQQEDDTQTLSCSCCSAQVAELRQQLEQAKQQLEAMQAPKSRSRATSARADVATSAKPSYDGSMANAVREQRSASVMLQQWQEQQQWQQWRQAQDGDDYNQPFVFGVFGSNVARMHGAWGLQCKPGNATARAASASTCGSLCAPASYRVCSAPTSPRRATVSAIGPQAVKVALQSQQYNTAAGQLVLHMHLLALQQQEQLQSLGRRLPVNVANLMQLAANMQATQPHSGSSASIGGHSPFSGIDSHTARHSITNFDVDRATGIAAVAGQAHLLPPSCSPSSAASCSPLLSVRACSLQQGHASRPASASMSGSLVHTAHTATSQQSARARHSSMLGSDFNIGGAQHSPKVPLLDLQRLQQQQQA